MKKHSALLLLLPFCVFIFFFMNPHWCFSQDTAVGIFDGSTDIGNCLHKGSAIYDPATQEYTITGSGADIWGTKDAFHFLWKKMKGDFILQLEFSFVGKAKNAGRKVGWMVRNDLSDDSEQINGMVHGHGLTALQYRSKKGGTTASISSSDKAPTIVQLERRGDLYILSTAKKGEAFVPVEFKDASAFIQNEALVGIYICSHQDDAEETAIVRNVRITIPTSARPIEKKD